MGFVGEEVKVLIEKRKVSRVHVRYKTLNVVILCSCFADCMTFSNVIQFFYASGIAHGLPLRRQVWICDDLSWWLIQKTFRGLHPLP